MYYAPWLSCMHKATWVCVSYIACCRNTYRYTHMNWHAFWHVSDVFFRLIAPTRMEDITILAWHGHLIKPHKAAIRTHRGLTHWGRDKMAAISQTTLSNSFSWMKMFENAPKISLTFVPKGPINNIPALVQIMAWRRSGDKPLSEPVVVSLLADICVTKPQWVKVKCDIVLLILK